MLGVGVKPFLGDGSFAEYVTVPVGAGLARIPDGVSFTQAAVLGLAGSAAVDALDATAISAGTMVLVAGATGGVGNPAVQLAATVGAYVIATARTDAEREHVTLVSTIAQSAEQVAAPHATFVGVHATPSTQTLDRLATPRTTQHTRVVVERTYRLDGAPDALAHFRAGTLGKLVILVVDPDESAA